MIARRLIVEAETGQRPRVHERWALGPTEGLRCLDLGSDNGVVSLLLRRGGGRWASADLTEEAVASIRGLVTSDVHLTDGARLPFADAEFDRVAVVDMLEHVRDEAAFVAELARVTRPSACILVSWQRNAYSSATFDDQVDAAVRGFQQLRGANIDGIVGPQTWRLLDDARWRLSDRVLWFAPSHPLTGDDVGRHRALFRAYGVLYPAVWALSRLDALVPASGYMLLATARRR